MRWNWQAKIYDTLARSAVGSLLSQIYLETRQALEVRNQGGVWVKVHKVKMLSVEPKNLTDQLSWYAW